MKSSNLLIPKTCGSDSEKNCCLNLPIIWNNDLRIHRITQNSKKLIMEIPESGNPGLWEYIDKISESGFAGFIY
ncbi:MAG: hypothetical protein ACM3PT_05255 [Deltaproteobacteria bacterium]